MIYGWWLLRKNCEVNVIGCIVNSSGVDNIIEIAKSELPYDKNCFPKNDCF